MQRDNTAEVQRLQDWARECLQGWSGRELSQVRFSAVSLVLDFWEAGDDYSAWLYANSVELTAAGAASPSRVLRSGADVLALLHPLLGSPVTAATVTQGRLLLSFSSGQAISVGSGVSAEGWAVVAEAWGTMTCGAGGVPTITSQR